jgi:hypothetical protein
MTRWARNRGTLLAWLHPNLKVVAFAGIALWLIAACKSGESGTPVVTIEHEVTPQPVRVGSNTITLRLSDLSGDAVTGAGITLEGNMSHAGMAPVFAKANETEPGKYQSLLELSMAGDWIVLLHLTLANGESLERQFEIKGVRSN